MLSSFHEQAIKICRDVSVTWRVQIPNIFQNRRERTIFPQPASPQSYNSFPDSVFHLMNGSPMSDQFPVPDLCFLAEAAKISR